MSQPEPEAGPILDRLIELRVFGRKPVTQVPRYSSEEDAAELVIAKLNRPPLRWMSLRDGEEWTFHWRKALPAVQVSGGRSARYVQMVTATAPTRPLAICRAALKLIGPLGAADKSSSQDLPKS
jgi:hypothetical protein